MAAQLNKSNTSSDAGKKNTADKNNTAETVKKSQSTGSNKAASSNSMYKLRDIVLWGLVALFLVIAIGGNYAAEKIYAEELASGSQLVSLLKDSIVILIVLLAVVTAAFTTWGKHVLSFAHESYIEIRKVVWPTRQEATTTTVIIGVITFIVSIMLWLSDMVFMYLTTLLNKI